MKIVLLGHGVVGAGVFELCAQHKDMEIVGVLCKDPENVPDGKGFSDITPLLQDKTVDTVVEVMGGLHPAYELVCTALQHGKNVVSANKYLICHYYKELTNLACQHGAALRCTAAVGGGIPWLVNLQRARRCDTVRRISGIMNGTTNYILSTMHAQPLSFGDVLAEAQRLGYAEADPTADVDGLDIRRKLAISANVAFDCCITEEDIDTFGIRNIQDRDIALFKAHGYTCKLLADACEQKDGLTAVVEPCLLGSEWPEAAVPANYNWITMWGDAIGRESFFGQGAGRYPTAYNVVQDLVDIQSGAEGFYTGSCQQKRVDNATVQRRYYLRTALKTDWVKAHAKEQWAENSFITDALSPAQMHAAMHTIMQTDKNAFFAALL